MDHMMNSEIRQMSPKDSVHLESNGPHSPNVGRSWGGMLHAPKKRMAACILLLLFIEITIIVAFTVNSRLEREIRMEETIANLRSHLDFLESQYRGKREDVLKLQAMILNNNFTIDDDSELTTTLSPEVMAVLRNMTGTHAPSGLYTRNLPQLRMPFVFQLLPHLMNDQHSLRPAYHMHGNRVSGDIVIGIPTVKRDKESYLLITLHHLIEGISPEEVDNIIIVVMIGETDMEYVLNIANNIESTFPKEVDQGIIEVLSPSAAYYPDFEALPSTLGDSHKRVKWRTKQNLDTIYLMAYAQSRATYYLMLEDDVVAKKNYLQEIRHFTAITQTQNSNWFFIEYCTTGGIGKLFRSSNLVHFITYVQLFYNNMPIDWLLESYLADKVCTIDKQSKNCKDEKTKIRPKYGSSLFQHIGLYSSLKGKIQKVKDNKFGAVPTYYPHVNPPLNNIKSDIEEQANHSLRRAYDGETFFWGVRPKKGNVIEFWFKNPTNIKKYLFRSSNIEHVTDKFYETTVEALPKYSYNGNFTTVGSFDEFGLAEGELKMGPILALRLKVNRDSTYWVILSEIALEEAEMPARS